MKKKIQLLAVMAFLSTGYSYGSYLSNADAVTVRAKNIISDAFASMDTWIQRDMEGSMYVASNKIQPDTRGEIDNSQFVSMTNSRNGLREKGVKIRLFSNNQVLPESSYSRSDSVYGYSSQSKTSQAINYMDNALNKLGAKLGDVPGMQNVKATVGRAIKALATETTPDEAFNSSALRIMDDSLKILMLAPVKLAVSLTGNAVGGAAGVAGGGVAGFGAGVNRTAKAIMSQDIDGSLKSLAIAIPTTMAHALKGVVNIARLTAYGAAEGALAGGIVGAELADGMTGDIFGLEKNQPKLNDDASATVAERKTGKLAQIQPELNENYSEDGVSGSTNSNSTTPNFIIPMDPAVVKANSLYDSKMHANEDFNNAEEGTQEDDDALKAYLHADNDYGDHYESLNDAQMQQHQDYVTDQKSYQR